MEARYGCDERIVEGLPGLVLGCVSACSKLALFMSNTVYDFADGNDVLLLGHISSTSLEIFYLDWNNMRVVSTVITHEAQMVLSMLTQATKLSKLYQDLIGLGTTVALASLPKGQPGIHQNVGGITEFHLFCFLSLRPKSFCLCKFGTSTTGASQGKGALF